MGGRMALVARAVQRKGADVLQLVGRSAAIQEIRRKLVRVAQTDLPVMIIGEAGTGKELTARVLHDQSKRRNNKFEAANLTAIPSELVAQELFGSEGLAASGTKSERLGRLARANKGTLFLDDISEFPMEPQTRLLRVLQEGKYTPIGAEAPIRTDVRIIVATNCGLGQKIKQGLFYEDLFYRLNTITIRIPPLRERTEDVADLFYYFLGVAEKHKQLRKHVEYAAIERLKHYYWPGNVRELENFVCRLSAVYDQDTITADMVNSEIATSTFALDQDAVEPYEYLSASVEKFLSNYFAGFESKLPPPGLYARFLRKVESPLIYAALGATRGSQSRAADLLGLNRNTLRKKIRELGIDLSRSRGSVDESHSHLRA
jgi:two-component system, NtrC family, nitrogen regulation response regulator GlnG